MDSSKEYVGRLFKKVRRKRNYGVIRGAGVLLIGLLIWGGYGWGLETTIISLMVLVGFFDDWMKFPLSLRIFFYSVGVGFIMFGQGWGDASLFILVGVFLFYLIFVGAVRMMDGINGMIVTQFIIILSAMLLSNMWVDVSHYLYELLGFALAFAFFNLRNKSKLHLGEAGSIGIAFVLVGLFLWKIRAGTSWGYLSYLLVLLIDPVVVFVKRLIRGENVVLSHKNYLYQELFSKNGYSPVLISIIYALCQSGIILIWELILRKRNDWIFYVIVEIVVVLVIYLAISGWVNRREGNQGKGSRRPRKLRIS